MKFQGYKGLLRWTNAKIKCVSLLVRGHCVLVSDWSWVCEWTLFLSPALSHLDPILLLVFWPLDLIPQGFRFYLHMNNFEVVLYCSPAILYCPVSLLALKNGVLQTHRHKQITSTNTQTCMHIQTSTHIYMHKQTHLNAYTNSQAQAHRHLKTCA